MAHLTLSSEQHRLLRAIVESSLDEDTQIQEKLGLLQAINAAEPLRIAAVIDNGSLVFVASSVPCEFLTITHHDEGDHADLSFTHPVVDSNYLDLVRTASIGSPASAAPKNVAMPSKSIKLIPALALPQHLGHTTSETPLMVAVESYQDLQHLHSLGLALQVVNLKSMSPATTIVAATWSDLAGGH